MDCPIDKIESALTFLIKKERPLPPTPVLENPHEFDLCRPVDKTIAPQFEITYRQPLSICSLLLPGGDPEFPRFGDFHFACVKVRTAARIGRVSNVPMLDFQFGVDSRFQQNFNLLGLRIGDLSSTISLAPLEELTLEFHTSQRTVLEKSTIDSTEEITSAESTTLDKEVMNVVRSSSKTQNWRVDGSGSFTIPVGKGTLGIDIGGGLSQTITRNSQNSLEHVSEATKKSSQSLKALHKIEVRGVTEGLIQSRMTRIIKNPYPDRTLSLNVFQLLKRFSIKTSLADIRPALIFQINALEFDRDFVIRNSDFLQDKLLDRLLVDELPNILKAEKTLLQSR